MAEKPSQEKTELATPRRRKEARKRGQVARSQDLSSFLVMMAAVITLVALTPALAGKLGELMTRTLSEPASFVPQPDTLALLGGLWIGDGLRIMLPLWAILLLVGIGSAAAQVGFSVNFSLLAFKPERINPLSGFKRIFSRRGGFEFAKSILKLTLMFAVTWLTLKGEAETLLGLSRLELAPAVLALGKVVLILAGRVIMLMVLLALADYAFQRWQNEKDMMMTKQEVKEELKETDGDPMVKSRIRALQREIATSRMMEDVKQADVVVTNPTRFAIALAYDESNMSAPKVLAKGQRKIAHRIKEIARESSIPVIENKPLARALFAEAEVGQSVPVRFYQAVAELLAWVYQTRTSRA